MIPSTQQFSIIFDALLVGHEAGVTSLAWRTSPMGDTLLSTSTDSSLILWSPVSVQSGSNGGSSSLWINQQRFGDLGGQRLGGFVGGLWTADGSEVLAWGWSGGWRRWRCVQTSGDSAGNEIWTEVGALTGHVGSVKGIAWSPEGEYLISTGYVGGSFEAFIRLRLPLTKLSALTRLLAYTHLYQETAAMRSPYCHGTKSDGRRSMVMTSLAWSLWTRCDLSASQTRRLRVCLGRRAASSIL